MESQKLLQLIKCILNGLPVCDVPVTGQDWPGLIRLAQQHNIGSLLGCVLPMLSADQLPEAQEASLRRIAQAATVISSNQIYAAQQIQDAFEEHGIWHVMLKGLTTRQLYPASDMRSMNDLDILCKPQQQKQIRKVMEQLGYCDFQEGRQHDIYQGRPFVRVELHREMVAARSPFSRYYRNIWDRCKPKPGYRFSCELSETDAFVYNLVHLAEHLEEGGVGIRFIADVYVYDHCDAVDRQRLQRELETLGIWQLYCNVSCLAACWFAPQRPSMTEQQEALMKRLGDFVLSGGLFGSAADGSALAVQKEGRVRYFIKACFPGYGEMCSMYPWLRRWPVLLPWSWFLRGIRSLLYRRSSIRTQLRISTTGDAQRGAQLRKLYRDIGYYR